MVDTDKDGDRPREIPGDWASHHVNAPSPRLPNSGQTKPSSLEAAISAAAFAHPARERASRGVTKACPLFDGRRQVIARSNPEIPQRGLGQDAPGRMAPSTNRRAHCPASANLDEHRNRGGEKDKPRADIVCSIGATGGFPHVRSKAPKAV